MGTTDTRNTLITYVNKPWARIIILVNNERNLMVLDKKWQENVIDRFIHRHGVITQHNYIRYLLHTLVMTHDKNMKLEFIDRYLTGKHKKGDIIKRCMRLMER